MQKKNNKVLLLRAKGKKLLRVCGLVILAKFLVACCGKERDCGCGHHRRPCDPVYVVPPTQINNSGTLIIGDDNVWNQNETHVDNTQNITNTGSGSVNSSQNTNVSNNTNGSGSQTVNQDTDQGGKDGPQQPRQPRKPSKPSVVHDTVYVVQPCPQEPDPCPEEETIHIRVSVKGHAKITRTENGSAIEFRV